MKLVLVLHILLVAVLATPAAKDFPAPAAEFSEDSVGPGRWFVKLDRPADAGAHYSLTVRAVQLPDS